MMTDSARLPNAPKAVGYMCFTPDHDRDDAVRRFVRRYGHEPDVVFESKGLLRLGPCPERGDKND